MAAVSVAPVAGCALCAAIATPAGELGWGTWLAAYVDDVLVAFVQPDAGGGVLIAPREHVGALSTSEDLAGGVLAGVRRAMLAVRAFYGASGATVQPMADVPGCEGHVCYQVLATLPASTVHGGGRSEQLGTVLRRHLAPVGRPAERSGTS